MKKLAVLFLIIVALVGCTSPFLPTLHAGLGEEFVLHKGQSAIIEPDGLEVKLVDFIYSPCPPDAVCVWSGLAVILEYRINGQLVNDTELAKTFGYKTEIIDSDYKTYAKLKVVKG